MKNKDLIRLLQAQDPNAEIVVFHPGYIADVDVIIKDELYSGVNVIPLVRIQTKDVMVTELLTRK